MAACMVLKFCSIVQEVKLWCWLVFGPDPIQNGCPTGKLPYKVKWLITQKLIEILLSGKIHYSATFSSGIFWHQPRDLNFDLWPWSRSLLISRIRLSIQHQKRWQIQLSLKYFIQVLLDNDHFAVYRSSLSLFVSEIWPDCGILR